MNQSIYISIAYGEILLPVVPCPDGHDRVPLKPVCDDIGIDWNNQKKKISSCEYTSGRLGFILGDESIPHSREMGVKKDTYLIRIDRVMAFLNAINPRQLRSHNKNDAANWLETKHKEWDNALHDYETKGFAMKPGRDPILKLVREVDAIRNPELKRWAAAPLNKEYGLDIPIGKHGARDV